VGAFQTNGILTYSLEGSAIFYNVPCDIYILGINVSDDEENANKGIIMTAEILMQRMS